MHPTIYYLKNKKLLWHASHVQHHLAQQHTGFKELDDALQGGFPEYGVIDVRSPLGIGELRLLLPSILQRQQHRVDELLVLIAPPMQVNSEMLAEFGLLLNQVLVIQPASPDQILWSAEQSLKSGCCHSVIIWQPSLSVGHIKRLQLAAEKGGCLLFIMRQPIEEHISLPVTLSLLLSPAKEGIQAQITKRKGSWSNTAFIVNMYTYWPELSQAQSSNVLPFPIQTYQAG